MTKTSDFIPILWQDDALVVVDKPSKWLVHPTKEDAHESRSILSQVRDQIGHYLYPVHRLDKPTSGALLFALNAEAAARLSEQFRQHRLRKFYLAVCRGWLHQSGTVDHAYALRDESGGVKAATSRYWPLAHHELAVEIERYPQSRFSLVLMEPVTGRRHQLRRHMKHLHHPLIGDIRYGRGPYNRYFAKHYGIERLMLHAHQLVFQHPQNGQMLSVKAPLPPEYEQLLSAFGWHAALSDLDPLTLPIVPVPERPAAP